MDKIRILHITDTHLLADEEDRFLNVNSLASYKAVMELMREDCTKNHVDLLVLTGDLSHDDSSRSYEHLQREISDLPCNVEVGWVPGNHDSLPVAKEFLAYDYKQNFIFGNWQIILLNSHYDGHVSGLLEKKELDLLSELLEEHKEKKQIIFLHHHVQPSKSKWLDGMMVENRSEFLEIIDKYQNIKLVVSGHVHQANDDIIDNIRYITTPATSVQFTVNSQEFSLDTMMPGYRWIELYDTGEIKTGIKRVKYNKEFVPDLNIKGY